MLTSLDLGKYINVQGRLGGQMRPPDQTKSNRRNQEHLMWHPVHVSDARRKPNQAKTLDFGAEKSLLQSHSRRQVGPCDDL